MLCKKCGAEINKNVKSCTYCGAAVESDREIEEVSEIELTPEFEKEAQSILLKGVLALLLGCLSVVSIAGIILGGVNKKHADAFFEKTGSMTLYDRARVGRGISKAAIIVGIISAVLDIVGLIMLIAR